MKKRMLMILAIAFAACMLMAGCEESTFGAMATDEGTVEIEAVNASMDDSAMVGALEANDEGKIHVDFAFGESEEVKVLLIPEGEEQAIDMDEEEIEEMLDGHNAALEDTLSGTGTADYFLAKPGAYNVLAVVVSEKCSGTATISGK